MRPSAKMHWRKWHSLVAQPWSVYILYISKFTVLGRTWLHLVVKMRFILSPRVIDTIGLSRVGRDGQFLASNLWRGVNERTNVGTFLTPMQIFRPPNVCLCYEVGTVPFCDSQSTLRITTILNILNLISVWQISDYNTPCHRNAIVVWVLQWFLVLCNPICVIIMTRESFLSHVLKYN